jgi:hypothetical protein
VNYTTTQWAEAKREFLSALETSIAAVKAAKEKIREQCGQTFSVCSVYSSQEQFAWRLPDGRWTAYYRTQALADMLNAPDPAMHWECSLSFVRRETSAIRELALPEVWEKFWASAQK